MNTRPSFRAILLIAGLSTLSACATTGNQAGQGSGATAPGEAAQQGAGGGRAGNQLDDFFRAADANSRYGR